MLPWQCFPMATLSTPRAYYASEISAFLSASRNDILGSLVQRSQFSVDTTQRDAWQEEIAILQEALIGVDGALLLEFDVPRVGSRIDAVVLTESVVLVLEFKVGAKTILDADINQVWDYALDLKNFHKASHHYAIVPILISTGAQRQPLHWTSPADDKVYRPVATTAVQLQEAIQHFRSTVQGQPIDAVAWVRSPYHPTPTIIQAAQALYSRHSVEAIASSEAGENLTVTSAVVERIIDESRASKTKSIVFVTGVPGSRENTSWFKHRNTPP